MLNITKKNGGILLTLTPEGKEFLEENRDTSPEGCSDWSKGTDYIYFDLLEEECSNGWEVVNPEDIAALTDAIILSDEVERNDNGDIVKVGRVYWYPDYQIRAEIDDLYETGECFLQATE